MKHVARQEKLQRDVAQMEAARLYVAITGKSVVLQFPDVSSAKKATKEFKKFIKQKPKQPRR